VGSTTSNEENTTSNGAKKPAHRVLVQIGAAAVVPHTTWCFVLGDGVTVLSVDQFVTSPSSGKREVS
jgi:hypothetical protein